MIRSLQSLRGLFALMIFCHHFIVGSSSLLPWGGDFGVAFFLMLSGYVMALTESRGGQPARFGDYCLKRFARIYPLHLFCLALFIALWGWSGGIGAIAGFMANLFLLQSWIPDPDFYFSGNAVGWCLSDLAAFYLVMPALYRLIARCRPSAILAAVSAAAGIYITLAATLPADRAVGWLYIFPPARLLDFAFGIILWRVVTAASKRCARLSAVTRSAAELLVTGLCVVAVIAWHYVSPNMGLAAVWWLPAACVIAVFSMADRAGGIVTRVLHCPVLLEFGRVSFTFYMLHYIVIRLCREHLADVAAPAVFAISLAVSVGLAFAVARYIERPAANFLLRLTEH